MNRKPEKLILRVGVLKTLSDDYLNADYRVFDCPNLYATFYAEMTDYIDFFGSQIGSPDDFLYLGYQYLGKARRQAPPYFGGADVWQDGSMIDSAGDAEVLSNLVYEAVHQAASFLTPSTN